MFALTVVSLPTRILAQTSVDWAQEVNKAKSLDELVELRRLFEGGPAFSLSEPVFHSAIAAFDGAFARMSQAGLQSGAQDLQGLRDIFNDNKIIFEFSQPAFANWILQTYLPARMNEAGDRDIIKARLLTDTRNLFYALYFKHSVFIRDFHYQYREDFWRYVYSAEQRGTMVQMLAGDIADFTDMDPIEVRHMHHFDLETKLYFLEKIIETSTDSKEILDAINNVGYREYQIFPIYKVDDFFIPGPTRDIRTLQMSVAERAKTFLKYEIRGFIYLSIGVGIIAIPYGVNRLLSRLANGPNVDRQQKANFKRVFWSLSIKGWQRIQELHANEDLTELRQRFRKSAMLSATRQLVFKCSEAAKFLSPPRFEMIRD